MFFYYYKNLEKEIKFLAGARGNSIRLENKTPKDKNHKANVNSYKNLDNIHKKNFHLV